jgi:hypothetical protein
MDLTSAVGVIAAILLIAPGFVWLAVYEWCMPQRRINTSERVIKCLVFGCINLALWSWWLPSRLVETANLYAAIQHVVQPDRSSNAASEHAHAEQTIAARIPYWMYWTWPLVLLVTPVVGGVATAKITDRRSILTKILHRMGINPRHVIEAAWDYAFGRDEWVWITVTLKDNTAVRGKFGSHSLASTQGDERDLFIQEVYEEVDGKLAAAPRSAGVLIKGDEIKAIEFQKWE